MFAKPELIPLSLGVPGPPGCGAPPRVCPLWTYQVQPMASPHWEFGLAGHTPLLPTAAEIDTPPVSQTLSPVSIMSSAGRAQLAILPMGPDGGLGRDAQLAWGCHSTSQI